jgi:hypothetical protein
VGDLLVLLSVVNDSGSDPHRPHGDRVGAVPVDPVLSRRTALTVGTVALTALAGCAGDDASGPTAAAAGDGDPDQELVDRVVGQINETLAEVIFVRRAEPTLRPTTRHLVRVHQQHLAALEATPPDVTGPGLTFADAAAGLAAVRRRERELQRQLVAAALDAESGALARLLASMSAAVTQAVTVLPGAAA